MKLVCAKCSADYNIDPSKVPDAGGFFKCKSCSEPVAIPPLSDRVPEPAAVTATPFEDPHDLPTKVQKAPKLSDAIPLAGSNVHTAETVQQSAVPLGDEPTRSGSDRTPSPFPPAAPTPSDLPAKADTGEAPAIPLPSMEVADDDVVELGDEDELISLDDGSAEPQDLPSNLPEAPAPTTDFPPPDAALTQTDLQAPDMAADLPAAVEEPANAAPDFLTSIPSVEDTADELSDLPQPSGATPQDLDLPSDLPEPANTGSDPSDLPGLDTPAAAADMPDLDAGISADSPDLGLADMPSPQAEDPGLPDLDDGLPSLDDLPPLEDTGGMPNLGGLPDLDESADVTAAPDVSAPSLDDLPDLEGAPSLMDELAGDLGGEIAAEPAAPATSATSEGKAASAGGEPFYKQTRFVRIAGGVGSLAAVGGLLFVLGLPPFSESSKKAETPVTAKPATTQAEAPKPVAPPKPTYKPKDAPELTASNVNALSSFDLRRALEKHQEGKEAFDDLALWATYRLARNGDDSARQTLTDNAVAKADIADAPPLAAAATLGLMVFQNKAKAARKLGERLLKTADEPSPEVQFVVAQTMRRPTEMRKAVRLYDSILQAAPTFWSAHLERAGIQSRKQPGPDYQELVDKASDSQNLEFILDVGNLLEDSGNLHYLEVLTQTFDFADRARELDASRGFQYLRYLTCRHLSAARLQDATGVLERMIAQDVSDPELLVALSNVKRDSKPAEQDFAEGFIEKAPDAISQARLAKWVVDQALARNTVQKAKEKWIALRSKLNVKKAKPYIDWTEGWLAYSEGNSAKAKRLLQGAGRGRRGIPEARVDLARVTTPSPKAAWRKVAQLQKKEPTTHGALVFIDLATRQKRYVDALAVTENLRWRKPGADEPIAFAIRHAALLHANGNQTASQELLKRYRKTKPQSARLLAAEADLLRKGEGTKAALKYLATQIQSAPDVHAFRVVWARFLNDAGEHIKAQSILNKLFDTDKNARTAEALNELGRSYERRDEVKARAAYRESVELEARSSTYLQWGMLEAKAKRNEEATKLFGEALRLSPNNFDARLGRARIFMAKQQLDKALDEVIALGKVASDNPRIAELQGDIMIDLNRREEAQKAYERSANLDTSKPELLIKLARLQLETEDKLEKPLLSLRRLVKVAPNHVEGQFLYGLVLKDAGKNSAAIQALQACLKLEPRGEFAEQARETLTALSAQ